jgi:hypothetical protein
MLRLVALSAAAIVVAITSPQPSLAQAAKAQARLPAQMNIDNQRPAAMTDLAITDAEGKVIGKLTRPLAAGKKSVVKLAKAKGCEFNVQARFDDEGEVDATVNLCREKRLRFHD